MLENKPALRSALVLGGAILLCFAAGALGGLFTASSVNSSWYLELEKPAFNPPGWVFGPVWTLLYASMAVAVWDVWRANPRARLAFALFAIQLALNVGWSAAFFGLRSPGLALMEIVVLLIAIAATIYAFRQHRRRAALLMVPYFAWVSFAAVLNASIWWLNRGS